ncbi:MAG: type I pullulanase [Bacteroidales bacterium]|nr:type I pullulanase [Bacteroidales bacterium]
MGYLSGLFRWRKVVSKEYQSFDDYPVCTDENLWTEYTSRYAVFKIWSPVAEEVRLNIYDRGHGDDLTESFLLDQKENGLWKIKLRGDYKGIYYTFSVKYKGRFLDETPGIYATAVGVNGHRAMIIDLEDTNPEGWHNQSRPKLNSFNDIVLYELHVRDMTIDPKSGSSFPGKYIGLIETGTKNKEGHCTGIDHIKALGVTHVHLLPVFDYFMVDEAALHNPQFNWGYDPHNYNTPEGSYSTDPFNAEVRIKEFKQMVMGFHKNGIRVIMDVVFNHTYLTENSLFNREVPGYYYRQAKDGGWSNASGCGNETASERAMMRKYIIESCKFWATEYKIDGFRFDLMGVHDIETLNLLSEELKKIDPTIFVYGEGWTGGSSPLPEALRAMKANTLKLTDIAAFSDDMRDGVKGNVFDNKSTGFVSGAKGLEETIKFGVVGSTYHPGIDYKKCKYSKKHWAPKPSQAIGYVSCHDNNTLYDKLIISRPDAPLADIRKMHRLANAIVLTSQSVPFLHAGVEMMRTKYGEHNTYNLPDDINRIEWNWKTQNHDIFDYYRALIALRKNHPAFRMPTSEMMGEKLRFFHLNDGGAVAYQVSENANGDPWKNIIVVYNANPKSLHFALPEGVWRVAVKDAWIVPEGIEDVSGNISVPPISMMVLFQ